MNKLIIIESGDRLGKTSLVKGLCDHFDYKNITLRHCDKPPKNLSQQATLDFQFKSFIQEFELISYVQKMQFTYHNNIIIYDRFYLGEYVYGQLFRNNNSEEIKKDILKLEEKYLKNNIWLTPYLITLTADPVFFFKMEDGNSFSQTLNEKGREIALFKEIHKLSLIKNKLLLKVDKEMEPIDAIKTEFRPKEDILNEVIKFINGQIK